MKKAKLTAVTKIKKEYEKPMLTKHEKLTSIIAGIPSAG